MKLTDLNPNFVGAGGEGVTRDGQPVPERHGIGVSFDCPCGQCGERAYIAFANPLDGGPPHDADGHHPTWNRVGDVFETMTLAPSIQRMGGCKWHGHIVNGEVLQA